MTDQAVRRSEPRADRLATSLQNRQNSFDVLRLGLALLVAVDHAGLVLAGRPGAEPVHVFGLSLGYLGLNGFFVLSGLLIIRSLQTRGAGLGFVRARAARIYPALIAMVLIATFIIGPLVSETPYWSGASILRYGLDVLRFGPTSSGPYGFYPGNPFPQEFSGALWSLRYEVICYAAAFFLFAIGAFRWKVGVLIGLGALAAAAVVWPPYLGEAPGGPIVAILLRFALAFGTGIGVWLLRDRIIINGRTVLAAALVFVLAGVLQRGLEPAATFFLAAILIWIGQTPLPFTAWYRADLSYGFYIWHYPVMQILTGETAITSPALMFAAGSLLTLPLAAASWYFIERPALNLARGPRRIKPTSRESG